MPSTPTPTSGSPSPSNRGSRQPHLEHPPALQNPYSPTLFPRPDYLPASSTDQYDFSAPPYQRQRAISSYAMDSATLAFPEPQLYRSGSSKATYRPPNQDFRNDLQIPPLPSPAFPPALPPRDFVASPQTDVKQVTFRSFNPFTSEPYPFSL